MAQPFGRLNRRPVYKLAPTPAKSIRLPPKPKSNTRLYACIGGAVAVLVLGAFALH